jgi:hypothetical protein
MPSTQPPTPPTPDGGHRLDRRIYRRPKVWVKGIGATLAITSLVIVVKCLWPLPPSAGTQSWLAVAIIVAGLGMFVQLAVPGALVALRHPWGADYLLDWEQSHAHVRAYGLVYVWAGVVMPSGWITAFVIIPSYRSPFSLLSLAATLVAFAPMLGLTLFDRRR